MAASYPERDDHPLRVRAAAMALYSWGAPELVFGLALLAAAPFVLAALLSPALLSLAPAVAVIAPIADARAAALGAASFADAASPLHLALLAAGDLLFDAPGRIHLAGKAFAALLVAAPLGYFASVRFPAAFTVLFTGAIAAFVAAPFSNAADISFALFLALSVGLIAAPADERPIRARIEGALAGALLFALWMSQPIFALLGFLALSACPFLTGRRALDRYATAFAVAIALAAIAESLAPGLTVSRAGAASGALTGADGIAGAGAWGLAGFAISTAIVLFAAGVLGGREHAKGWLAAAVFLLVGVAGASLAGAQAAPVFATAAAIAAFSTASPFYDGVFRRYDRASIAVATAAASLTLFWTAAIVVQSAAQFALQWRTTAASADARPFGLVRPGGPAVARWIEEGRFGAGDGRELPAADQSAILLEAADRARLLGEEGLDVAFLTGADTACVIAGGRRCSADGLAAAKQAKVVFVPMIDFDAATAVIKGRSEALLYTDFKLAERTPVWEVWVRRGFSLPSEVSAP